MTLPYLLKPLLSMTTLALLACASVQAQAAAPVEGDILTIYKKDGLSPCYIKGVTGKYRFKLHPSDNAPVNCDSDEAYQYQVINKPPSALMIGLYDDTDCAERDNQKFYFILRIAASNISMPAPLNIADLKGVKPGALVAPGVMLERGYVNPDDSQVHGKLSCVSIKEPTPITQ